MLYDLKAQSDGQIKAWVANTAYVLDDTVDHAHVLWRCTTANNDATFTPAHWYAVCGINYTAEDVANKAVDVTLGGAMPSDVLYPSQKAVKDYVDGSFYPEFLTTDGTDICTLSFFPVDGTRVVIIIDGTPQVNGVAFTVSGKTVTFAEALVGEHYVLAMYSRL